MLREAQYFEYMDQGSTDNKPQTEANYNSRSEQQCRHTPVHQRPPSPCHYLNRSVKFSTSNSEWDEWFWAPVMKPTVGVTLYTEVLWNKDRRSKGCQHTGKEPCCIMPFASFYSILELWSYNSPSPEWICLPPPLKSRTDVTAAGLYIASSGIAQAACSSP